MKPIGADTCADIFRMLEDYVDRELTEHDFERVERHLTSCAVCAAEVRFEEKVLRRLRDTIQRIAAPADLHARVWKNVMARAIAGTPGEGGTGMRSRRRAPRFRRP